MTSVAPVLAAQGGIVVDVGTVEEGVVVVEGRDKAREEEEVGVVVQAMGVVTPE